MAKKHPKDLPPKPLTKEQQKVITDAGHYYAGTKAEGRKILLGDPLTYGPDYKINWTKPTYYAHGYRIIYKVQGAAVVTLQERKFDVKTGKQIGHDTLRLMRDNETKVVDRLPGTYISVFNPYPSTQAVEGDKDFGGGEQ